ncbi:hypothetical protein [uncultured Endozoicomonas sp.]|uniref:hypothetical protein n=1 Tax=uncultured Endozoicomonas sp. TaxID=432652 RepID=UPI00261D6F8E|nr:hypothetical protein [uncultured Endozoicomonas sp.]
MNNPIRYTDQPSPYEANDQPSRYEANDANHQRSQMAGLSTLRGQQVAPTSVNCQLHLSEAVQVSFQMLGDRLVVKLPPGYQFGQVQVGQLQQGSQQSAEQQKRAYMLNFIDEVNSTITVSSDYPPEFNQWCHTAHQNEQIQWAALTQPGTGGLANELTAQTMNFIKKACEDYGHLSDQGVFGNSYEKAMAYARKHQIAYPGDAVQLAKTDGRYYVIVSDGQGVRKDNVNCWLVDPWAGCQFQLGAGIPFRKDYQTPTDILLLGKVVEPYKSAKTYIDSKKLTSSSPFASNEILRSVLYAASRCPGSHFYFDADSCNRDNKLNDFLSTIQNGMRSESVYCLGFSSNGMINYLPLNGQLAGMQYIKMAVMFTDNDWEYWASFFQKLCPLISSINDCLMTKNIQNSVESFNQCNFAPLKMMVLNGYLSGLERGVPDKQHKLINELIENFHESRWCKKEPVLLTMVKAMLADDLSSNDKNAFSERLRPLVKSIIFDSFANYTEGFLAWYALETTSMERLMQLSMLVNDHYDDFTREFQKGLNKHVEDADKREPILTTWIAKAREANCQPLVESLNAISGRKLQVDVGSIYVENAAEIPETGSLSIYEANTTDANSSEKQV